MLRLGTNAERESRGNQQTQAYLKMAAKTVCMGVFVVVLGNACDQNCIPVNSVYKRPTLQVDASASDVFCEGVDCF